MTASVPAASTLGDTTAAEPHALLFARYLKALALLCECQPYVDDPDYEAQLEALLRDACTSYGLEMRHADGRFEIALDRPLQEALAIRAACGS